MLNPAQAMELEIKKGDPSPIDGVLFDYDSYREVVSTDLFHEELKKSYLELSQNCMKLNNDNKSEMSTPTKVLLGFIAGAVTTSLVNN